MSDASNQRCVSHLAALDCPRTLMPLSKAKTVKGHRHRGLQLLTEEDGQLIEAVARGQFALSGFRNGDIRAMLSGEGADPKQRRRRCGQVSQKLGVLKAHGLIRRVPRTPRRILTDKGAQAVTLLTAAKSASAQERMYAKGGMIMLSHKQRDEDK